LRLLTTILFVVVVSFTLAELMGRLGDWARAEVNRKYPPLTLTFGPESSRTRCCCADVEAHIITREQLEQLEKAILSN